MFEMKLVWVFCGICGERFDIELPMGADLSDYDMILPSHERYYLDEKMAAADPTYDDVNGYPATDMHRRFPTVCNGCAEAIAMTIDLRRSCRSTANEVK
jgi:hypothetical protein